MYPVNTHVSEEQETNNAQEHPRPAWEQWQWDHAYQDIV